MGSGYASAVSATRIDSRFKHIRASLSTVLRTAILLAVFAALAGVASAQVSFLTSRGDNARDGANTNETLLTPANVNPNSFGHLFSTPIDYQALAQPLYVPDVNIPGQGTHNVVYVVTQNDSAYAFDADNGAQLWHADLTNGGVPATVASGQITCGLGPGFDHEGAVGTPVIDTANNTMYVVSKTVINETVMHFLFALNIATGAEQMPPVQITATSMSKKGHVTNFSSHFQKNRPGALLLNGTLYLGFGGNSCDGGDSGWVLAYNPTNLQQVGVFNTSPDTGLTSIWQSGNGLAGDDEGNIFFSTAENNNYDVASGGQSYSNSILKLTPAPWAPQNEPNQPFDFFTPWTVAYLNDNDRDISSVGPIVLPDQQGNYPHELIASGKQAIVYVLDRDNMGQFVPGGTDNVIQEIQLILGAGADYMCSPAYWNGLIYFMPNDAPLQVYQVSNGLLSFFAQTPKIMVGAHSPSISANGTTNGILWLLNGNNLQAYNAITLQQLYGSDQVPARDKLPIPTAHFATQTVVNGKVYVATQGSLEAYGLLDALTVSSGNNQSAPVATTLPAPVEFVAANPYNGQVQAGVTVTFSDGRKGGIFNPASAITNASGVATTTYTFPKKSGVYTLTASATNLASASVTATATPLAAKGVGVLSGDNQTGAPGSTLPKPIVARVHDVYGNPIPGVAVTFSATAGASVNPNGAVTNSAGEASTVVQLPATTGTIRVTASSAGLSRAIFEEYSEQ